MGPGSGCLLGLDSQRDSGQNLLNWGPRPLRCVPEPAASASQGAQAPSPPKAGLARAASAGDRVLQQQGRQQAPAPRAAAGGGPPACQSEGSGRQRIGQWPRGQWRRPVAEASGGGQWRRPVAEASPPARALYILPVGGTISCPQMPVPEPGVVRRPALQPSHEPSGPETGRHRPA